MIKEEPNQFMDRLAKTGHRFFKNDTSAIGKQILGHDKKKKHQVPTWCTVIIKATVAPTVHHIGAKVQ